jgi:hypothetical protein
MFGAIKRVISGDDVAQQVHAVYGSDEIADENMSGEREPPQSQQSQQPANTATNVASAPPVLVESDPYDYYDDMDEDVHFKHINDDESGAFTTGSELTTDSHDAYNTKMMIDDNDMMIDYTANVIPEQHSSMFDSENFPRNDSHFSTGEHSNRASSSQNSSRDWGWFEDVYNAENHSGLFLKRKDQTTEDKLDEKKGKTGGGLPMVSDGTHGAVTQIIRTNPNNGRLTVFVCSCFLASCSHRLFASVLNDVSSSVPTT